MLRHLTLLLICLSTFMFWAPAAEAHTDVFFSFASPMIAPPPPAPVPAGRWECASFSPMSNRCLNWAWVPAAYYPGPVVEYYPYPVPYYYHHHHHHPHVVY